MVLPGCVDDVTLLVLLWVKQHDNATEKKKDQLLLPHNWEIEEHVSLKRKKKVCFVISFGFKNDSLVYRVHYDAMLNFYLFFFCIGSNRDRAHPAG